jgi:uncharacterized protein (DUF924 family)
LLASLQSLRQELDELDQAMRHAVAREGDFPHRAKVLAINRRLAERIIAAHRAWLDEVEDQL